MNSGSGFRNEAEVGPDQCQAGMEIRTGAHGGYRGAKRVGVKERQRQKNPRIERIRDNLTVFSMNDDLTPISSMVFMPPPHGLSLCHDK